MTVQYDGMKVTGGLTVAGGVHTLDLTSPNAMSIAGGLTVPNYGMKISNTLTANNGLTIHSSGIVIIIIIIIIIIIVIIIIIIIIIIIDHYHQYYHCHYHVSGLKATAGVTVFDVGLYVNGDVTANNVLSSTGGITVLGGGVTVTEINTISYTDIPVQQTGGITVQTAGLKVTSGVTLNNGGMKFDRYHYHHHHHYYHHYHHHHYHHLSHGPS